MKFFKTLLWIIGGAAVAIGGFFLFYKIQIESAKPDIRRAFLDDIPGQYNLAGKIEASALDPLIEGKSIIGFGEATHGTKEFHVAFTQFAKYLITSGKINILVYAERNFADSWLVNEFVLDEGDTASVEKIFPHSSSEEKELIEWIKAFNKGKAESEKVWVAGADMYYPKNAAINGIYLINENRLDVPADMMKVLNDWACAPKSLNFFLRNSRNIAIEHGLNSIYKKLGEERSSDMQSLRNKWMVQSIKLLGEGVANAMARSLKSGKRDSIMFDNVNWILSARENARLLVFAHNSHIEKVPSNTHSENNARLGWLINQRFASSYFTVGSEVEKGSYSSGRDRISRIPQSFMKLGSIIGNSVERESGYINVHQSKDIEDFLDRDWYITYGVVDTGTPAYPKAKDFSKAFDLIFWVKNSTPSQISDPDSYDIVSTFNRQDDQNVFLGKVTLHLKVDFSLVPIKSNIYDYPDLGALFYAKKKLVDHHFQKIDKSQTLDLNYGLDPAVDSIVVYIGGDRARSFSLDEFSINNSVVEIDKILFSAPNYKRTDLPDQLIGLQLQ